MFGTVEKLFEIYEVQLISKIDGSTLNFKIECINAKRGIITELPNPQISGKKRQHPQLSQEFTEEEVETSIYPYTFC